MADSLKRISKAKDAQFQDKVDYYLFQKALTVLAETTPDADELAFAKTIYAGSHNVLACAKVVVSNATIGAKIDADTDPTEAEMEYVVLTEQWNNMAVSANVSGE